MNNFDILYESIKEKMGHVVVPTKVSHKVEAITFQWDKGDKNTPKSIRDFIEWDKEQDHIVVKTIGDEDWSQSGKQISVVIYPLFPKKTDHMTIERAVNSIKGNWPGVMHKFSLMR